MPVVKAKYQMKGVAVLENCNLDTAVAKIKSFLILLNCSKVGQMSQYISWRIFLSDRQVLIKYYRPCQGSTHYVQT